MNINYIYEDDTIEEKFWYDSFTGTYWLQDEEWAEPMEFTEDELVDGDDSGSSGEESSTPGND